jgi:hypothetical protein
MDNFLIGKKVRKKPCIITQCSTCDYFILKYGEYGTIFHSFPPTPVRYHEDKIVINFKDPQFLADIYWIYVSNEKNISIEDLNYWFSNKNWFSNRGNNVIIENFSEEKILTFYLDKDKIFHLFNDTFITFELISDDSVKEVNDLFDNLLGDLK